MTKKITFTFEAELIDQLSNYAQTNGKKKTQIVREALRAYFATDKDLESKWLKENREAMNAYNDEIEQRPLFSDGLRSF